MKFRTRRTLRTMVAALALSGTLIGGSVALAYTSNSIITASTNGERLGDAVEKSSASGSKAYITLNTAVPSYFTLKVNIRNKYDNIANASTATFSACSKGTEKSIPYKTDKGKKGNKFEPAFSLQSTRAGSDFLTINYTFTP